MSDKEAVKKAISEAADESRREVADNPHAPLGRCRLTAVGGYTGCIDDITESACGGKAGPGITATGTRGRNADVVSGRHGRFR